jgi:DNA-directed RNA polymerase specialized sigma24 family protein
VEGRVITDQELVEKYGRYCGYWARHFLCREIRREDERANASATQSEAEDLASIALIQLVKCPQRYRGEKKYVTRVIINGVLEGLRTRRKIKQFEWQPPRTVRRAGIHSHSLGSLDDGNQTEYFDSLPGPDGLAGKTQIKFDSSTACRMLESLPIAEKIVLELHFGLTGLRPASERQISKKLSRPEFWVQRRLQVGLIHMRQKMGAE